jgi:rhamnose transport system permease protein
VKTYQRELATAMALAFVLLILLISAPSFFQTANLRDLMLKNTAALVAAIGMTMVIVTGHIDISIGAQFAICGVVTGVLAREGVPIPLAALAAGITGAAMGALNGVLVAWLRMPSIVVTLAAMSLLRDSLRWVTEGAWVQDLPRNFQWAGLGQSWGQPAVVLGGFSLFFAFAWALANLSAGRALFATGADPEAARLAGIPTNWVVFFAFTTMGILCGAAAVLNAIRFNEVPGNPNNGLELQVIAAVVVGGASITGGRATLLGTLLGVTLLGILGTALTFLGVNPFWEKALQGGIILIAAASLLQRKAKHAAR